MSLQHQVFSNPRLLRIPTKRAAWSDRTALLMAEMSKLAHHAFEKDADGNVMPQADLDGVLARLLAPDSDAAAAAPSGGDDADQPPADGVDPRMPREIQQWARISVGMGHPGEGVFGSGAVLHRERADLPAIGRSGDAVRHVSGDPLLARGDDPDSRPGHRVDDR